MIVQKDFLSKLKDFNLNSYEAKLWTALLSRGVATAGELSDISNVPRSRSYDVLESLERKGFVIMKLGKPIKYIAVPPAEVVDRVKKRIQEDASSSSDLLEELKSSKLMEDLTLLHKKGIQNVDPVELVGSIKGRDNLYTHIGSLIKNAEKSVLLITTEQGLIRKSQQLKNSLAKAKDKGIKIRILAPVTKQSQQAVNLLSKYAQIKNSDFSARFCIIDGKQVSIMALDDSQLHPTNDFGIWVNTDFFTKSFENIFEHLWEQAK